MQLSSDQPRQATAELLKLAEEAQPSGWHEQQALSIAARLMEETGDLGEALQLYKRTLEVCKGEAVYWTRATAHILAEMALLHFREGREAEGVSTAYEALRYLGREPEIGAVFAELIQEMSKRQEKTDSCSPA